MMNSGRSLSKSSIKMKGSFDLRRGRNSQLLFSLLRLATLPSCKDD